MAKPCARFEQRLADAWNPADWTAVPAVLGVSGGADSVALARALAAIRLDYNSKPMQKLIVAHLNHGLRGHAADDDARFVAELADQLDLPCEIGVADLATIAEQQGDGLEAAARLARYAFFEQVAEQYSARYVAVAHTRDDQVETILHRIIRGTGLRGLAGMPRARLLNESVTLIRPLLDFSRSEVRDYLTALAQPFRHDATNDDSRFTRNRIRNELLPRLRSEYNVNVDEALSDLGVLSAANQRLVDQQVEERVDSVLLARQSDHVALDCRPLAAESDDLTRELLRHVWRRQQWPLQSMSRTHWEQLARLGRGANDGVLTLPGNIRAEKKDGQLMLTRPMDF